MGIQGLLPLLKSTMVPIHIKDLEGCSVAVDTYSWLHKGALSCSKELCKGQPTSKHVEYCMHRVNLLRHYGVRPLLVFDGGLLPMKSEQESKRARARKENLARAIEHESNGNYSAAYESYQKAVDISPSVAYDLIQVLKQQNVGYIVAPYEADAQMAFLAVSKLVDAVITEDSDLIAFGCSRIIYKMDKFGQGVEFQYSRIPQNKELNLAGFTRQMLLEMCILSGCDYLQSLPGMGLKRAHALVKKFRSYDMVIKHLKYNRVAVPPFYEESFKKAILTFRHQRVYDPVTEDIVHLSELSDDAGQDLDFLGPPLSQEIAKSIAIGNLDPFTQMPFQEDRADGALLPDKTYKPKNFRQQGGKEKLDLPMQKNLLTNYFCFASLEAKRKFIAPRLTTKHPNPRNKTSCSEEDVNNEVDSHVIHVSPASFLNSKNLGVVPPIKDSGTNGAATKAFPLSESVSEGLHDEEGKAGDMKRIQQHVLLQQSSHSVSRPCVQWHKEHECSSVSDASEGKENMEIKNVAVKSSYFRKRSPVKIDLEMVNEHLLLKDHTASARCESTLPENNCKSGSDTGEGRRAILKSSYFQKKTMKEYDQDSENGKLLEKDDFVSDTREDCKFAGADEGNSKVGKAQVIVRSSYFKHKSVKENNPADNKQEKFLKRYSSDACENDIHESSAGIKSFRGICTKRKVAPIHSTETESNNRKYIRTNSSSPTQSDRMANLNNSEMVVNSEPGKFGCNISHLEQYSGIAEKSMEKFISIISAFRCPSSGSRASGLRAPLKDVRNTPNNRLAEDLSKYAYVSTKKKVLSASR